MGDISKMELYAYKAIVFDMTVREGFGVCSSSHESNFLLHDRTLSSFLIKSLSYVQRSIGSFKLGFQCARIEVVC